jgi:hypothetical protein
VTWHIVDHAAAHVITDLAGNGGEMYGHQNEAGEELGHGLGTVWAAVNSWVSFVKGPDFAFTSWRRSTAADMGPMTGRALFVSKSGSCAGYAYRSAIVLSLLV